MRIFEFFFFKGMSNVNQDEKPDLIENYREFRAFFYKALKCLAVFLLITCCCVSCKETVHETLQVLIQNRTDSVIHISLYPKGYNGSCYYAYEGSGGCRESIFDLPPYSDEGNNWWSEMIFASLNLNIEPHSLILREFDSIYISTTDNVIIFTPEKVTGYTQNIFSEQSTWDFELKEWDARTIRRNPQKSYLYRFFILNDQIVIE